MGHEMIIEILLKDKDLVAHRAGGMMMVLKFSPIGKTAPTVHTHGMLFFDMYGEFPLAEEGRTTIPTFYSRR